MSEVDKEAEINDLEMLDSLLADIDLGVESDIPAVIEQNVEEEIAELEITEDIARDLDLASARREIYATVEPSPVLEATELSAKKTVEKKAKVESGEPKRVRTALENLSAGVFVMLPEDEANHEEAKKRALANRPKQKKVNEKFENLFTSLSVSSKPSNYVVEAFKIVDARGSVTSSDLVAAFRTKWSEGTSRSQVGQIMQLFSNVKIAARAGFSLTLNKDSVIGKKLRTILEASAA